MLRRTTHRPLKLILVESPNKVAKVTEYASAIKDLTFGRGDLPAGTAGEPIVVKATVGHFMHQTEVNVKLLKPMEKKVAGATENFGTGSDTFAFDAQWHASPEKKNRVEEIQNFIKASGSSLTEVILATDPDREGELISEHALQLVKGTKVKVPYSRAYMQSITSEGVAAALKGRSVNSYDKKLASAAATRHVLDRLFGYFGSAMMQTTSTDLKSVGRVQTPALIIVHDREVAHDEFLRTRKSTFGFSARAVVGPNSIPTSCTFVLLPPGAAAAASPAAAETTDKPKRGRKSKASSDAPSASTAASEQLATWSPSNMDEAKALSDALSSRTASFTWTSVAAGKPVSRSVEPPQPLTLQALMLRLGRRYLMSSEDVMKHCQQLFTEGHITYPRTDSIRIDAESLTKIKKYATTRFGKDAVASDDAIAVRMAVERVKGKKSKAAEPSNVEDAHEAIHPTHIEADPATMRFSSSEAKLVYEEIRDVTLASVMVPQELELASNVFTAPLPADMCGSADGPPAGTVIQCRVHARRVVTLGFSAVLSEAVVPAGASATQGAPDSSAATIESDSASDGLFAVLSAAANGTATSFVLQSIKAQERKAAPPALYFEGSLIEELKSHGIGRPSTYASILQTLKNRGYVTVDAATGRMRTTPLGKNLVAAAKRYFPIFVDLGFTSKMEAALDGVVKGKETPDSLSSSVWFQLLRSASEVARASYFKDAVDRAENKAKNELVAARVVEFSASAPPGTELSLTEYCNRVRSYLRRQGKFT